MASRNQKAPLPARTAKQTTKTNAPEASSSSVPLDVRAHHLQDSHHLERDHGRLLTADQLKQKTDVLVDVSTEGAIIGVEANRRIDKLTDDLQQRDQRAELESIRSDARIGHLSDQFQTMQKTTATEKQDNSQSGLAKLKAEVEQDIHNLEHNMPHLFRDAWVTIDRKCQEIAKLEGAVGHGTEAMETLRGDHLKQKREDKFNSLMVAYNASREQEDFGAFAAQQELQKFANNPYHLPNLPPNDYDLWMDKEQWLPVIAKFLDVMKARFLRKNDWPEKRIGEEGQDLTYDSWSDSACKVLKPAATYFKEHKAEIIQLGGADARKSGDFAKQLTAKSNTTFKGHVADPAALASNKPNAYYRPFYTGFLKCLYIERQVDLEFARSGTADLTLIEEDTPVPAEYSPESFLGRIRSSWSESFGKDKSLAVRAAAGSLFRLSTNGGAHGDLPKAGTSRVHPAGLAGIVIPEDNEPAASGGGLARAVGNTKDGSRIPSRSSVPAGNATPSGSGKEPSSDQLGRAPSKRRQ